MKPAIVLGHGVTALGVLRTLGRAGIPAYTFAHNSGLEARSRWYRELPVGDLPVADKPELPAVLGASKVRAGVLFPCSDYWLAQVASLQEREDLSGRYPASVASADCIAALVDKARFGRLLGELAVPHPHTQVLERPSDIDRVPDSVLESAFLKPHNSQLFFSRFGLKAFRIHSREEARSRATEAFAAGLPVLLQEYVPGPGSSHYFVDGFIDRNGRLCATFARRRLRMHPPDFGNSSCMISVGREATGAAVDSVARVLAHVGFRGIFSAEFKLDPRDHSFRLLEVNARPWWYVEFAARCGVDVCRMAYVDAIGGDVGAANGYLEGARLVYPYYDYFACKAAHRAGQLPVSSWLRSWAGSQNPLFNWTDPLPAVAEVASMIKQRSRRVSRPPERKATA